MRGLPLVAYKSKGSYKVRKKKKKEFLWCFLQGKNTEPWCTWYKGWYKSKGVLKKQELGFDFYFFLRVAATRLLVVESICAR